MIIDDDRAIALCLSEMITDLGFENKVVTSGEEALKICNESMPDIIFLDWMMPEMDGMSFLEKLILIESNIHPFVIMCTGKGADDKAEKSFFAVQSMASGANLFLQKPVKFEDVKKALEHAVST